MIDPYRTEAPSVLTQLLDGQSRRWQQGDRVLVESYLSQQSTLHPSADQVLSLLFNEIRLRTQAGERPDLQEYVQRFPHLEAPLREQFAARRAAELGTDNRSGDSDPWRTTDHSSPAPDPWKTVPPDGNAPPKPLTDPESKWNGLLAPAQRPEELGRLGAYPILQVLGEGGMGAVFRGRDDQLGRDVAIKVILERHNGEAALLQRFLEEAQICGQLQHPGVVPLYELGTIDGRQPYFTMKLVKGLTLAQLLQERQAPDLPRLVTIFGQVCQAMAYAHDRRVIHRDLKPANIMVGAFGEVQVMDWGLAKILPALAAEAPREEHPTEEGTVIHTESGARSDAPFTPAPDSRTALGAVLGTPAYMSPEQARGEIGQLDQRCDVFALGAILCQILTGKPPYENPVLEQARRGNLARAFLQLDACGADVDLIALAKRCLQPQRQDRPQQAGEVATAITAYQESVQARAEEERKRRVVAQMRAEEEGKRRRLTVALAAVLLLLVGGGSAAGLWYQHDQTLRYVAEAARQAELDARRSYVNKEVRAALAESEEKLRKLRNQLDDPKSLPGVSELLSEPDKWRDQLRLARLAWQQAQKLATGSADLLAAEVIAGVSRVQQRLQWEESGYVLAEQLDQVRLRASTPVDGKCDYRIAAREYPGVFAAAGLEVKVGEKATLAARIAAAAARPALVAALDDWASVLEKGELQEHLLALTRQVDPDRWRDRIRDVRVWNNATKLEEFAKEVRMEEQSPQLLIALALRFPEKSKKRLALLRQAVRHHQRDFWLYFFLGNAATAPVEQMGWYQAALAVRPRNIPTLLNLGNALRAAKDFQGAKDLYRKVINLDSNIALAYNNLGTVLHEEKDLPGAKAQFRKAIDLDPNWAVAYHSLGNVLHAEKDLQGAKAQFRKAIDLDPIFAMAYNSLGVTLHTEKDFQGAKAQFRKAIDLDPNLANPYCNLGTALRAEKDLQGAKAQFHKAIDLDPNLAEAYNGLGIALYDEKDFQGAKAQYRKAIDLDPSWADAYNNLGIVLLIEKDLQGSKALCRKAIDLDPNSAKAYYSLGTILYDEKDFPGAKAQFRKAIDLDSNLANAYNGLGLIALFFNKDFPGAKTQFHKAIDLDPNLADAYCNLGIAFFYEKDFQGAKAQFHKAIDLDPGLAKAYSGLGTTLRAEGDFQGAKAQYRKAIDLNPNLTEAYNGMGNALSDEQDFRGAIAQYRKAIDLDPGLAEVYNNLGNALRAQKDFQGAKAQYRKAIDLNPNYAPAYNGLGGVLGAEKDFQGAIAQFRKAIGLDAKDAPANYNLGKVLLQDGQFTEATRATRRFQKLLPVSHPWQKRAQQQLIQCEKLLVVEEKLNTYLEKGMAPAQARGLLELIELCRLYKLFHATAAKLSDRAFTVQPALAADLSQGHRYQAARSAALAAAGQSRDPAKLSTEDKTKLRAQALTWLQADLQRWTRHFQDRELKALPELLTRLPAWQQEPAFAPFRDLKELAKLPADEQKDWAKLWADVDQLAKALAANVRTERFTGTLTAKHKEQTYEVKLLAGQAYVIDLESPQFDTYLKLQDAKGKTLAESDDIAPDNFNSRLEFTPAQEGTYRFVATSYMQQSVGTYTLTVRQFLKKAK